MGHIDQALNPDTPINCPTEHSKKNRGTPPMMTNIKYGIRKAPVDQGKPL